MPARHFPYSWLLAALGLPCVYAGDAPKDAVAPGVERLPSRRIENLFRLAPTVYSGGEPTGRAAFAELRALGVKTVVSVDGAAPDAAAAKAVGLRTVHLPMGYDGVSAGQARRLLLAARSLPPPLFVHCHHGKHRGPAAAGLIARSVAGWTPEQTTAWLRTAGTDPRYAGLYRDVLRPPPPPIETDPTAALPEASPVPALVDAMVVLDRRFDLVKAALPASAPADQARALEAAILLVEDYREAARLPDVLGRDDDFRARLAAAERRAVELRAALTAGDYTRGKVLATRAAACCAACHAAHRDQTPRPKPDGDVRFRPAR
ncbi:MAG: hypothetical protein ACRDD1_04130 [Planctomycetia bacterium]